MKKFFISLSSKTACSLLLLLLNHHVAWAHDSTETIYCPQQVTCQEADLRTCSFDQADEKWYIIGSLGGQPPKGTHTLKAVSAVLPPESLFDRGYFTTLCSYTNPFPYKQFLFAIPRNSLALKAKNTQSSKWTPKDKYDNRVNCRSERKDDCPLIRVDGLVINIDYQLMSLDISLIINNVEILDDLHINFFSPEQIISLCGKSNNCEASVRIRGYVNNHPFDSIIGSVLLNTNNQISINNTTTIKNMPLSIKTKNIYPILYITPAN